LPAGFFQSGIQHCRIDIVQAVLSLANSYFKQPLEAETVRDNAFSIGNY
jgi:hypothetical protein